jgi:hypothetical protein
MLKGVKGQKFILPGAAWWKAYFLAYHIPAPIVEYRFDQTMRRLDLAWPSGLPLTTDRVACAGLTVEIQGGNWKMGAHVRPIRYQEDRKKSFDAQILGWVVLEVTWAQVKSGELASLVEQGLETVARRVNAQTQST